MAEAIFTPLFGRDRGEKIIDNTKDNICNTSIPIFAVLLSLTFTLLIIITVTAAAVTVIVILV